MYGARTPMVRVGQASVALPPGAFLQAVPAAEAVMADFVIESVAGADKVADLYCGVGAFALRLAVKSGVLAIDSAEGAVKALASARATAPGLRAIEVQTRDLARRPLLAQEMAKLDAVVFDPPRAGAAEQCLQIAASKVARVVGVSCNPATFARDARILTDAGFALQRLLPVDQFLWSPHVELVGVFSR
jgi:23S rRNA (uracil1939-C5)-methyltransferase